MDKWRSPLRYPGGKMKLAPFLRKIVENNSEVNHYIEPFAGGGGIAINLLLNNLIDNITLNDFDIAIYCFWKTVTENNSSFMNLFDSTPVTIDEWKKQKKLFSEMDMKNANELTEQEVVKFGFATFFLNRTNFSGILRGATPIGGLSQRGKWKLDCEFNKDRLRPLLIRIGDYSDKITVSNLDMTIHLLDFRNASKSTLMFIDPPYVKQGKRLYLPIKDMEDHQKLAEEIKQLKCNWILTYDDIDEIKSFYNFSTYRYIYSLQYKVKTHKSATEFIAISKNLNFDFSNTINIVKKLGK